MSKKKPTPGGRPKKKAEVSLVRSSAAEYLTFVAASGAGGVEAVYADENVWLTQKMMGVLYAVETHTVNYHLKKIFDDTELEAGSVIRNFRITAADGKTYDTQHYNLPAIIAVGSAVGHGPQLAWATVNPERCSSTTNGHEFTRIRTDDFHPHDGQLSLHQTVFHHAAVQPDCTAADSCPLVFIRGFLLHGFG